MQASATPKPTDDRRDFIVIPSDQVRVAPSDAEITDLLRAAARQHSEAGSRATSDPDTTGSVVAVDTTFRASAVNDDLPARGSNFGRRLMRAVTALLLAAGITGAALGWQFFGYAAKKAVGRWLPQIALTTTLFDFGSQSKPTDQPTADAQADAATDPAAAPAQNPADGAAADNATASTAAPSANTAQQLQSMANDLANANQQIETLKASIAELKAGQQQMVRDLAKASDKLAEQNAKTKVATTAPRPPVHRPAPVYSPSATYSPAATAAPSPAYRPAPSSYSAQATMPTAPQPYVPPPPIPLQPQADPGVPRPPMPVQ